MNTLTEDRSYMLARPLKYLREFNKRYRFPPDSPKIIDVGKTIGHSLMVTPESDFYTSQHTSIRPHIRCGHWNRYWVEKRKGAKQAREIVLRWLAPVCVNTGYLRNSHYE